MALNAGKCHFMYPGKDAENDETFTCNNILS